jgi:hypothetical protein
MRVIVRNPTMPHFPKLMAVHGDSPPVDGRRDRIISCHHFINFVVVVALLLTLGNHSAHSLARGTYVAMFFGGDYLVIGADSRIKFDNQPISDEYCKIIPLSKQTIFIGIGITALTGRIKFAANDIAHEAYAFVGDGTKVDDLAKRWATLADNVLSRAGADYIPEFKAQQKSNGDVLTGVFTGVAKTGRISVYKATLKVANSTIESIRFTNDIEPIPLDAEKPITYFGANEVTNEFIANTTGRARKANDIIGKIPVFGATNRAFYIYQLVKFVISFAGPDLNSALEKVK